MRRFFDRFTGRKKEEVKAALEAENKKKENDKREATRNFNHPGLEEAEEVKKTPIKQEPVETKVPVVHISDTNIEALRLLLQARDLPSNDQRDMKRLDLLNRAISLNPRLAKAVEWRSSLYRENGLFWEAALDYMKLPGIDRTQGALLHSGSGLSKIYYSREADSKLTKEQLQLIKQREDQYYEKSQELEVNLSHWEGAMNYYEQGDYYHSLWEMMGQSHFTSAQKDFYEQLKAEFENNTGYDFTSWSVYL